MAELTWERVVADIAKELATKQKNEKEGTDLTAREIGYKIGRNADADVTTDRQNLLRQEAKLAGITESLELVRDYQRGRPIQS